MDFQALASTILNLVGGKENVANLTHCATRLRFNLNDEGKADEEKLKQTKGVLGVVKSGGQFQVIIGNDVPHVYQPIAEQCELLENAGKKETPGNAITPEKKSIGARLIDTISGIFTPVLPAITAAGMLRAVLALLVAFHLVSTQSQSYQIINFMADAAFYFLPILLANSAARKFGCSPYLAIMVGGILLHPNFISLVKASKESGEAIRLFLIPVYNANYSSTVVPIILSVWLMSYIQPFAEKISPKLVRYFTAPLITILITGSLALTVVGPIGYVIGNVIADIVKMLETHIGWLLPMVIGGLWPLLVMTGTHYGLVPIGASNVMNLGYDALIGPGGLSSNIAQGGASLAVAVKTKNKERKGRAYSSGLTAVCGITEPALYGVNLRYKTPLYAAMVGGAIAGLFAGIFKVRRFATGSSGLCTLPVYIGGDGMTNFFFACATAVIAFVIAFIVSYILYKDDKAAD